MTTQKAESKAMKGKSKYKRFSQRAGIGVSLVK